MDTTEQLNGTYFYGGLTNLSAGELYFWIMIDVTAEHFSGTKDIIALVAIYSGQNTIDISGKLNGAWKGTSYASVYSRKLLRDYRLPFRLPTWIQNPKNPLQIKMLMTHKLGTFVGRTIPVLGWVIMAADVAEIGWKTTVKYNLIAHKDDRIW